MDRGRKRITQKLETTRKWRGELEEFGGMNWRLGLGHGECIAYGKGKGNRQIGGVDTTGLG
jgi:hypothetical protein